MLLRLPIAPILPICAIAVFCTVILTAGEDSAVKKPSPGSTTYYVDAVKGDDANAGTSSAKAWKTLDRANQMSFAAGDRLLLAGGQKFPGTLVLSKEAQGTKDKPITISSYGQDRATIDAGKGSGVRLDGCSFVQIRELILTGCGRKEGSDGNGIEVSVTKGVEIDQVEVSGFRLSGISTGGDADTRITRVNAHDNGAAGINTCGGYGKPRTTNLYIGHCVAHDNPGDPKNLKNHSGNGIVVGQLDGGLIEYCEAYNNGWDMPRKGNGPVGIWGWEAHRLTIQFCISHDNKTQKGAVDGGGFDFDGGMVDSVLQYNLSYNNHGSGYLLCQYPGASVWKNNICRYNITINDAQTNHEAGIHFWEGQKDFSDAQIYNNLIVNSRHAVKSTGDVAGLVFRNNIFISDSDSIAGPLKRARFEGNLYFSPKGAGVYRDGKTIFKTLEEWVKATGQETVGGKVVGVAGDPKASLPLKLEELPKDPKELAKMLFGRLQAGSPCMGCAVPVPENGGRDFWGNVVPKDGSKNIGPYEGAPVAPVKGAQGPTGEQGALPLVLFTEKPAFETQGEGAKAEVTGDALRVTFGPGVSSGVLLKSPKGGWDLSAHVAVRMDVKNVGAKSVAVHGKLNNSGMVDGFAVVEPGKTVPLEIILKRKACTDVRSKYFDAMNGLPGGFVKIWDEALKVDRIGLYGVDGADGGVVEIRNVYATGTYTSPPEEELKGAFFPFVDRYGQYKHADWPNKAKADGDLARQKQLEAADIGQHPGPKEWDQYGGWATGPKLEATGHFRTQKHEGKWWLVDPEGRLFWSHGITCIRMNENTRVARRERYFEEVPGAFKHGENCDFGGLNLSRKYGADWLRLSREEAHLRLRSWGMNTMANWSDPEVYLMRKTPYVVAVHYSCPQIGTKFPDVNRPEFRAALRKSLEEEKGKTADDPWCIGYFIDNELTWPSKDRGALAETYHKTCREEMKRVAPNKLYLGSRLHGHSEPYGGKEDVVRAAAKYCDVIGVNRYRFTPSDLKMADGVDVPLMIGEFHWGALDRGLLHTGLRSVANQEQRGAVYVHYVTQALKHPNIVGTHWFQYHDQVVTGRGDGENYQIGFVDICDTPYAETVEACRRVGYELYRIRTAK